MPRRCELSIPVRWSGADVGAVVARVRERRDRRLLRVSVRDNGRLRAQPVGSSKYLAPATFRGTIVDRGGRLVLSGVVRESWNEVLGPWILAVPAALLGFCSLGALVFEGLNPGLLLIGLPGAAVLGWLAWKNTGSRQQSFDADVRTVKTELRNLLR